jgi:hypothetical protein
MGEYGSLIDDVEDFGTKIVGRSKVSSKASEVKMLNAF